ncbi:DUF4916 domain-containing protein [Actinomycetes bacterium]|jgi:ADP-ribose pyrophosphatase YjhB (NUDIX family)|nr:DUF4916 domain-containing protein [Actinomycetes bacterium]
MSMINETENRGSWLNDEQIEFVRDRLPILYIDAIPVRIDELGNVTQIGLLLRGMPDGSISRAMVSGRVLYGERIRGALLRHLEKDLGATALPQLAPSPTPFTIVEYFPDPSVSGFHDPRQHAVSLAFVVVVKGDCRPSQNALDLAWLSPQEAQSKKVLDEMTGGQAKLLKLALAHMGVIE